MVKSNLHFRHTQPYQAYKIIENDTPTEVFSYQFYELLKSTFFTEQPQATSSVHSNAN